MVLERCAAAMDVASLLRLQALVREIEIGDHLLRYATRLIRATRPQETSVERVRKQVGWGAGPRWPSFGVGIESTCLYALRSFGRHTRRYRRHVVAGSSASCFA